MRGRIKIISAITNKDELMKFNFETYFSESEYKIQCESIFFSMSHLAFNLRMYHIQTMILFYHFIVYKLK